MTLQSAETSAAAAKSRGMIGAAMSLLGAVRLDETRDAIRDRLAGMTARHVEIFGTSPLPEKTSDESRRMIETALAILRTVELEESRVLIRRHVTMMEAEHAEKFDTERILHPWDDYPDDRRCAAPANARPFWKLF